MSLNIHLAQSPDQNVTCMYKVFCAHTPLLYLVLSANANMPTQ